MVHRGDWCTDCVCCCDWSDVGHGDSSPLQNKNNKVAYRDLRRHVENNGAPPRVPHAAGYNMLEKSYARTKTSCCGRHCVTYSTNKPSGPCAHNPGQMGWTMGCMRVSYREYVTKSRVLPQIGQPSSHLRIALGTGTVEDKTIQRKPAVVLPSGMTRPRPWESDDDRGGAGKYTRPGTVH